MVVAGIAALFQMSSWFTAAVYSRLLVKKCLLMPIQPQTYGSSHRYL